MKDVRKRIIIVIIMIVAIFSVAGFAIWISNDGWPEGELELYVHSIPDNDIITVIGDTVGEKELMIYYNRNKGSADREFLFFVRTTPQFIISLNDKQLHPVTDTLLPLGLLYKNPWVEHIRLTHLYEVKHATLTVSPLGEKDCFFENETFALDWGCTGHTASSIDYYDHKNFLIRYYNVDKVRSLNWNVSEGFNLSIDESWLKSHFVDATTSCNGWYILKGHLSNYDEPWKDVDVDLWYKPDTIETITHIEELS